MATETYIGGRKQYGRPQALLFSDNQGTISNETFLPSGDEFLDFIILTDDNRESCSISIERIEQRERMINGRMRSYHIADKKKLQVKWNMIPSRAFEIPGIEVFDENGNWDDTTLTISGGRLLSSERFTTDGGAAGVEMLKWNKEHPGSFWVYVAYDNYDLLEGFEDVYVHLAKYNERLEMYFEDFSFEVVKRGPRFDYWNVSLSLVEV